MGSIERLLNVHREDVLGTLDVCLDAAWTHGDVSFRSAILAMLGTVPGFSLTPSHPWKRASAGLRLGLRRITPRWKDRLGPSKAAGGTTYRPHGRCRETIHPGLQQS